MSSRKRDSQCLNCGITGHTSKFCNSPTISCGVICYRKQARGEPLEFLMIQRKDTLCFVEFIRGNYELSNKNYIVELFNRMTDEEKKQIRNNSFDPLWNNLWLDNKKHHSNYKITKDKFTKLKNGFYLKKNDSISFVDMNILLDLSDRSFKEQEWDFPKGRRKLGEKDFHCAVREFQEESNLSIQELIFLEPCRHFEETYLSNNKVRYKNVYFVAKHQSYDMDDDRFKNTLELYDANNVTQAKEVRDVKWFTYNDVLLKLKDRHVEKVELFKLVHNNILKKNTY
jgi:8-oxo-dGTP pyrophosphatase MutT (NUDIX family)